MPVGLLVLLLLIGLPLIEIAVFVIVGGEIGALTTILLTVATAIAGTVMLRLQGLSLITRMRGEMDAGRVPESDLVEGTLMVVASVLLLIPGFVTDAIGLLLFIPPLRAALARVAVRNAQVTIVGAQTRGPGMRPDRGVVDLDADDWRDVDTGAGPRRDDSPWIPDARNPDDPTGSGPRTGN